METLGTTGWRPEDGYARWNAVDYDIEEATDRCTQPKYYNLNDRIVNIHYYDDLPVVADLDKLTLSIYHSHLPSIIPISSLIKLCLQSIDRNEALLR